MTQEKQSSLVKYEQFQLSQKAVIYSKTTKKFLLLKDAEPESEYVAKYGLWDLPGGRLEKGEALPSSFERELREEIGDLKYELRDIVYATTVSIPLDDPESPNRVRLISLATTEDDTVTLSDEHTEAAWKTFEEIDADADCGEWLKRAVTAALTTLRAEEGANDTLRILADFENYKKRVKNDERELYGHLTAQIVNELIPVLDNFHAATGHVPADAAGSPWVTGITYIEKQFEDVLANYGVTPLDVKPGDAFDPTRHEALDHKAAAMKEGELEGEKKLVIEKVVQKGYLIKDKLVRPAKVIVTEA